MITPEDIKKKVFSKGFRGYETEEVDKYVAELAKEYEYLYLDNIQLKETVERVSSKLEYYQQMESTIQSTLAVAQESAEEIKANSEKKAALLEQETQVKCEQHLAEASVKAKKMHEDTLAHSEDLYNQTKVKTDNMLNATRAECEKLREETRAYTDKLRRATETEAEKLKATTDDICKKRIDSATAEANQLLEKTRKEVGNMMLEANTNYRKIVGDAEERSRKLVFAAESKAAAAENAYNDQLKKSRLFQKNINHLLETQLELVKNFAKQTEE